MKVNIYYGGRGLMDDPTLYVISKMQEVLEELNVKVERFMLYELKNSITTLPQTLKEADGVILASTVEWYGIGGYMQQFLDACWLYGDKEKISQIYMCPVVMSTTSGEREGKMQLAVAWEILGGKPCSGICGYMTNLSELENNEDYNQLIEKKAENVYRSIKQKVVALPCSNQVVQRKVSLTPNIDLTPQETEQLSQYAADDSYVQRQKEDIQELADLFRGMMDQEKQGNDNYVSRFESHFHPIAGLKATYKIAVEGTGQVIGLQISGRDLKCREGWSEKADVEAQITQGAINEITAGRMTFQRAFMGGDMKMKGDFKLLRSLDDVFVFMEGEK